MKIYPVERRKNYQQQVLAWARRPDIAAILGGLLEGPGGSAPDLFCLRFGETLAIYFGDNDEGGHRIPDLNNDWCTRWEDQGGPPLDVYVTGSGASACQMLLARVNLQSLASNAREAAH